MLRSQKEIIERIEQRKKLDMMGFEWIEYVEALEYDNVLKVLGERGVGTFKEEVDPEKWEADRYKTVEDVKSKMVDYLEFAWEKANGFRGLSAQRSVMHYLAWAWLVDDEFYQKLQKEWDDNYEYYGKDILVMICEYLGVDANKWDDGVRKNDEE